MDERIIKQDLGDALDSLVVLGEMLGEDEENFDYDAVAVDNEVIDMLCRTRQHAAQTDPDPRVATELGDPDKTTVIGFIQGVQAERERMFRVFGPDYTPFSDQSPSEDRVFPFASVDEQQAEAQAQPWPFDDNELIETAVRSLDDAVGEDEPEIDILERYLENVMGRHEDAVEDEDFSNAARLGDLRDKIINRIDELHDAEEQIADDDFDIGVSALRDLTDVLSEIPNCELISIQIPGEATDAVEIVAQLRTS